MRGPFTDATLPVRMSTTCTNPGVRSEAASKFGRDMGVNDKVASQCAHAGSPASIHPPLTNDNRRYRQCACAVSVSYLESSTSSEGAAEELIEVGREATEEDGAEVVGAGEDRTSDASRPTNPDRLRTYKRDQRRSIWTSYHPSVEAVG